MYKYKVVATVNNMRTEVIISANNLTDAKKLFMAQYAGQKVSNVFVHGPLH